MESKKRGSVWKWVLGCGGVSMLVFVCGALWLIPQMVTIVRGFLKEEGEREAFAVSWLPPGDNATAKELFPESLAGFQRSGHDEVLTVDRFNIELKGRRAVYSSPQAKIEVFIYRASSLEKEAIYRRVLNSIGADDDLGDWDDDPYTMRMSSGDSGSKRLGFTVKPPFHKGQLWWSKDWLFFFLTESDIDLEAFQQIYLDEVQGSGPASSPPDTPTESPTGVEAAN